MLQPGRTPPCRRWRAYNVIDDEHALNCSSIVAVHPLPQASDVSLEIYNVHGQRVRVLIVGAMAAGSHPLVWDGRADHGGEVESGVYYIRGRIGDESLERKILLVR